MTENCESQPLHIGKETVPKSGEREGWGVCLKIMLIISIIDVELIF